MEQKQIKGSQANYYSEKEKRVIERVSKYINLGVNSAFDVGDIAHILSDVEYREVLEEIKQLKDSNNVLDADNKALKEQLNSLSDEVTTYENEIQQHKNEIDKLNLTIMEQEQELNKYSNIDIDMLQQSIKELSDRVTNRDEYIIYLELLQSDYKVLIQYLNICKDLQDNRNAFNRLLNKDATSDIDKPTLELINFDGSVIDKKNAPIININHKKDVNSE